MMHSLSIAEMEFAKANTVRAVHIEVVQSLETDSFLQALQRFICRRGQVEVIRSDNGTNFVGAAKELRRAVEGWTREYLPTLQLRRKWTEPMRNVEVGDIVILMCDNAPRNTWPLGRVTETFPGADGLVRSVKLTTGSTILTRPIHKLCLLEPVET